VILLFFSVLEINGKNIDIILNSYDFDCVVCPGGEASSIICCLGQDSVDKIRNFVSQGGGYLGVCAGAIAAGSNNLNYLCLAALRCEAFPYNGVIKMEIKNSEYAEFARRKFEPGMIIKSVLHGGPLMTPMKVHGLPEITEPDAIYCEIELKASGAKHFLSDLQEKVPGSWAVVRTTFGYGNVMLFGPHPELDNEEVQISSAVEWMRREKNKTNIKKQNKKKKFLFSSLFCTVVTCFICHIIINK